MRHLVESSIYIFDLLTICVKNLLDLFEATALLATSLPCIYGALDADCSAVDGLSWICVNCHHSVLFFMCSR